MNKQNENQSTPCQITLKFKIVDILYILMMILPIATAIVLKVLFTPASEGVSISGALVYARIPFVIQDIVITEAQINSWLILITIFGVCLYMTHGLSQNPILKRQHFAEMIVEKAEKLINDNMGEYYQVFTPFIMAIMAISAFSSLMALFGLFPPTSDMSVVSGWSILVFGIITYYKLKCGPLNYMKEFTKPVAVLTPINIIGEFATPISMAFRHYGNVLSGMVVSVLVGSALQGVSRMLLGWAGGFIGSIPLFQIGIPAVLSVYFDVFSGLLQAFIFAMLTMLYVADAFNVDEFELRRKRRAEKKKQRQNA